MNTRKGKLIYWIATGLLAFGMTAQGVAQILQAKGYADMMAQLGYPQYLLPIIGVWKLLGVAAILTPRFSLAKEWAYAGFFFLMSGAAVSHLAAGDRPETVVPALILLLLIAVSWYFRPAARRLVPATFQNTQP